MRLPALFALIALSFPASTGSFDGGDLINAVLGNSTTPGLPAGADETVRIQTHLFSVVERLSATDMQGLSPELCRARARNIVRLLRYASAGQFPSKPDGIPGRVPNFMDDDGALCAVGYLVAEDLGIEAVRRIAGEHQFDYVPYINSPLLAQWQTQSGLTPLELAMIQPTYDGPHDQPKGPSGGVIERTMVDLVHEGFSGQVVVARDNKLLLDASYGFSDSAGRVPVTRDTGYDIASATKAFTAAAIYQLMLDGDLRFSDTLGDLVDDAPPTMRRITIGQLMAHTSGLGNTYAADGETDRTKALTKLLAQPLANAPGGRFEYSDDGYVVLAAIIEIVSGKSYEDYLERHIVDTNRMHDTTFWGEERWTLAEFSRPLDASLTRPQWGQRGSGGIISTAHDLCWWALTFLAGDVVRDQELLTKPRAQLRDGTTVGYGWFQTNAGTREEVLWTRGNEDFGHNALLAIYTGTASVLVVTSNRFHGEEPWSRRVQSALEPFLLPK